MNRLMPMGADEDGCKGWMNGILLTFVKSRIESCPKERGKILGQGGTN
jgi:hypothetical protein